jgi:flagellar hook-basal body complex protein FliE
MMIPALSIDGLAPTQAPGDVPAIGQGIPGSNVTGANGPSDFGSVLSQVANGAMNTLNTGEATAISGLQGNASVQQVVKSVLDAQQAVQTVVAIRDKVVSAYQEISRMAI